MCPGAGKGLRARCPRGRCLGRRSVRCSTPSPHRAGHLMYQEMTTTASAIRTPMCVGDAVELLDAAATITDTTERTDLIQAAAAFIATQSLAQVAANWAVVTTAMDRLPSTERLGLVSWLADNAKDEAARFGWANIYCALYAA